MMKKVKYIFLSAFTLFVCLLQAQKVTVHFEGTVFDEENAVIKGAIVEVRRGAVIFNYFKADENGNYNLYLPLNGEYDVTVSKQGYVQKKYFVSTKDIPEQKSNIAFATNVADVVLFTRYEGIDYSLFDRPMNLYSYSEKKDNIIYDEDYLKAMKLAMKEFKKMQGEAIKLAREKAKLKKKEDEQLALENENIQRLLLEHFEKPKTEETVAAKADAVKPEEKVKTESKQEKNISGSFSLEQKSDATVVSTSAVLHAKDARTLSLLQKYHPGVTEEIFQGDGVVVIQRVLVRDEMVWIYQKKIFSWGGIACFRDRQPITESAFEQETKKS